MNPTGKKIISLFLVFSLMTLSVNLYAKERRGAKLIITNKERQQISGELIAVKPNSLLLLNTEGKDVSVDIGEIEAIRIAKKKKFGTVVVIALLVTLFGGLAGNQREDVGFFRGLLSGLIYFGIPYTLLYGLFCAIAMTDKKIQLEGMSDSEIQKTLDYLRKKARIRDYK